MISVQYIEYNQMYLDSLLTLWNETLIYDPISKDRFLKLFVYDENFNSSLAQLAIVNDEVVGFCYGVKRKVSYYTRGIEPDRGWINYLFVKEPYQHQGIGQHLYDVVVSNLKALGTKEITLCAYSPNYLNPGVDVRYTKGLSFFEKNGFEFKSDAVSMQRSLFDFVMPNATIEMIQSLKEEGITFKNYEDVYFSKLMNFLEEEFEPGWKRNVIMALQTFEAKNTIILCLNEEDNVLGYCMRKIDGNDSRFGPIGVAASLRSKGLGGVLFDLMMLEMKKHGVPAAYFLWTSGAAIRFYERHGMSIYRSYKVARKEIQ